MLPQSTQVSKIMQEEKAVDDTIQDVEDILKKKNFDKTKYLSKKKKLICN